MTCPHCRADNPAEAKFCGSCGKPLESPKPPPTLDDIFKWIGIGVVAIVIFTIVVA